MTDTIPDGARASARGTHAVQPPGVPVRTSVLPAVPAAVVPPAVVAASSEVIVCPECGTPSPVTLSHRDARDFCPRCDYPLFWARPQDRAGDEQDGADDARWRSPGASGALLLATVPCPACAELNLPSAVTCIRCGADMTPPPPPPPVPVPMPVPVVVAPPPPPPAPRVRFPWWWYLAMLAVAGAAWWVSRNF